MFLPSTLQHDGAHFIDTVIESNIRSRMFCRTLVYNSPFHFFTGKVQVCIKGIFRRERAWTLKTRGEISGKRQEQGHDEKRHGKPEGRWWRKYEIEAYQIEEHNQILETNVGGNTELKVGKKDKMENWCRHVIPKLIFEGHGKFEGRFWRKYEVEEHNQLVETNVGGDTELKVGIGQNGKLEDTGW